MTETAYEKPQDLQGYMQAQGANLYQTPKTLPVAADAFRAKDIKVGPEVPLKRQGHQIGRGSKEGTVRGMQRVPWSITSSLIPSGSAGTGPDDELIYLSGNFSATADAATLTTTVSGNWSAYNTGDLTSVTGLTANQSVVKFTDTNGGLHARLITDISTLTVTVSPPLTFYPAITSAAVQCKTYQFTETCEELSFTLWKYLTHTVRGASGCVANTYGWTWGTGEDGVQQEISGFGRSYFQAGPTTINEGGAWAQAATSLTVANDKRVTLGTVLVVESENILVTAKSAAGVLTVTRGYNSTSDVQHADGTTITVYEPSSVTLAGNDAPPDAFTVDIGTGSAIAVRLETESGTLNMSNGVSPRERGHGDEWVTQGYGLSSDREINLSLAGWMQNTDADYYQDALDTTTWSVCLQNDDVAGRVWGAILPRVQFDPAKENSAGDDHVGLELTGMAVGSRTGARTMLIFVG